MRRRWSLLWTARFVAKWEGFLPDAYLDTVASPPVLTQGYGHTGAGVTPSRRWSRTKALRVLAADCRSAAAAVNRMADELDVKLTVRQRIAFISGAFNCGPGILDDPDIRSPLRRGDWAEVVRQWEDWCHAGGVVVQGLLNRRREEGWLMRHSARPKRHKKPKAQPRTRAHKKPGR